MRSARNTRSITEALESRTLFSGSVPDPIATIPITTPIVASLPTGVSPNTSNASAPYTPALVRSAYGIGSIAFNGTSGTGAGQTIAIIDAYNDPKILADANSFSSTFSLPSFGSSGGPTLSVLGQTGSSTLPANSTSSNGGWDVEESLDVEWAHAVAPSANIILYEANSASMSDLTAAATTAADTAGVSAVSMSFGSTEFSSESYFDNDFLTPSGHAGVTFLASTGDDDSPAEYPAYSPNVVAVGGTSLAITTAGSYVSESAWGNTSTGSGGGGGVSSYESQPSYQTGHVNNLGGTSSPKRTAPDVSFDADPNTGVYVYDSYYEGTNNGSFYSVGGTSLACPMWAGLIAVTDQGRGLSGLPSLDGKSQVLPTLYTLSSSDYHDVTTGNNGFAAGPGYDLATGLGTPVANLLVPQLVTLGAATAGVGTHLAFSTQPPGSSVAGATFNLAVHVLDANGNLATGDAGTVTLTLTGNAAALDGPTTATVSNGVASFSGLWMTQAGSGYTITAVESAMTGVTSTAIQITPASASQLAFAAQPSATTTNTPMGSPVSVAVEDSYGNVESANTSTVTLTLSSNAFRGGATTQSLSSSAGVAVFTALAVDAAATYTLAATDGSLSSATSNPFTVAKATPTLSGTVSAGTYNAAAQGLSTAVATDANTAATLGTLGDGSVTVTYYAGATALSAEPTAAGTYSAVVSYAGNSNYFTASDTVPFSIAPRVLSVTAVAQNKNYDRTTAATATLSDNRVAGDGLTVSSTGASFVTAAAGTAKPVTVAGLSLSGPDAPDYTLASTTATTTATIAPLNVTGTITAAGKIYDGTTLATLSGSAVAGVLPGDSVTLAGAGTFDAKDVGTGRVVTAAGLSLAGPAAGDYVLTNPTEFSTASITARPVTATITAASKIYDGTTAATLTAASLTNAISGDAVALSIAAAPVFNSATVPDATTVIATGLSLTGAAAGDYTLTNATALAAATIQPLPVTGSVTVAAKVFDGTTAATILTRTLTGALPGDDVSLAAGTAVFADAKVATDKSVTVSGLALAGAQAGDYLLADPTEKTTASIAPMVVTGNVFSDTNLNGIDDAGEPGFAGRTVYLELPGHGTRGAKSTRTDASGDFTFTNVAAGNYVVALAAKSGWRATTGVSQTITLAPGSIAAGVSFGQTNRSTVTGAVFLAAATAGTVNAADLDLAGVTLTLTGTGRAVGVVLTAVTGDDGTFAFAAIPPGTYRLTATAAAGLTVSPKPAKAYTLNLTKAKTLANCNFGELPITAAAIKRVTHAHRRAA